MLKKLTLALAASSFLPGFVTTASACGGCGGSADGCCASACDMSAPATAAAAKPATVAQGSRRSYRSYSYAPGYRSYRGSMMRGFGGSSVRGADSKILGR